MIECSTHPFDYKYSIFGMKAASDMMFPQLTETTGEADIYISRGKVPEVNGAATSQNRLIQVSERELLFSLENVGRYYISKGRYIVVEPDSKCDEQLVQLYILGSAMGAIMFQRGIMPIHGSAVVIGNKAVIITGESGAGKSSLTLAFREMGHKFLTDDIAALTLDKDGQIFVQPAYPQQKLWKDSIEAMGEDVASLSQIINREEKYYYPAEQGFCDHPVRLGAVCEIIPNDRDMTDLIEVQGVEKVDMLLRNIYRYQLAGYFGSKEAYLSKCAEIANSVNMYKLLRPVDKFTTNEQAELILSKNSDIGGTYGTSWE